jgi:hypothetical protein
VAGLSVDKQQPDDEYENQDRETVPQGLGKTGVRLLCFAFAALDALDGRPALRADRLGGSVLLAALALSAPACAASAVSLRELRIFSRKQIMIST